MKKVSFYDLYCEEVEKNKKLENENKHLLQLNQSLERRVTYLETNQEEIIESKVNRQISKLTNEFENKIISLEKQVGQLKSVLNNDSSNSGIPTSKTPINKEKRIPNSREKTDKLKGGQPNHKKHQLVAFEEEEITEYCDHKTKRCSKCLCEMKATENYVIKDETDFRLVVQKRRHRYYEVECPQCHQKERVEIPKELKEENQYGKGVQGLALSLTNQGFVSMKRTREIIEGLTQGEISPSEGYISKLQKRMSQQLNSFHDELKKAVIQLKVVHWDDTVIAIDKNRSCLRFYGNEEIAYYQAHLKKDKDGLDKDGILSALDKDTIVVHDHNKVNYNEEYEFQNAECCVHLLRDLKKVVDNLGHEWPKKMIELLLRENHKRNHGEIVFAEYVSITYDQYVAEGWLENSRAAEKYGEKDEATLLKRLEEYKENYLMWTLNDEIPFSNNISERSLRNIKTKMKVSGQFANIQNAEYFAKIKSYLETGHRHHVNTVELLERALNGNAMTLIEMKERAAEIKLKN